MEPCLRTVRVRRALIASAFEIATNPGAPFGDLGAIASGGELARFALALKAALAGREEAARSR